MNELDTTPGRDAQAIVDELKRPLERISEAKFGAAAALLEEIRDVPGVQQVLDHVRPRLVKVRPKRKPNLQRLFYRPLEDLIIEDAAVPGTGLLPRHLPAVVWRHVVQAGDADTRKQLEAALRRTRIHDLDGQRAIARRLWPWVANLLADLAADPAKLVRALGPDAGLAAEVTEIRALCQVADAIETLKDELPPRPISDLSDEQMGRMRRIVAAAAAGDPERTYVLVLACMVRMAQPMAFLKSFMGMTLGLSAADRALVYDRLTGLVVGAVGDRAQDLREVRRDDLVGIADRARALVIGVTAAEKVLKSDPDTRRRLGEARKTAELAVAQLVDDATDQLATAIAIGPDAPLDAQIETENSILALRKCQTFAGQIGLDRLVNGALGKIVADVRAQVEKLFQRIAGRAGSILDRGAARLELYWAVRMTELASNPDDADKLRRKGLELIR
jgi:hypothetical protein